ncbi:MFS general substrate transporter [Aureobasidium pullulans]|uniref:MFS general substrate transporter n=1 Tax=Aureobasidium pullulans TaxID=5580 RepID=A0A4S9S6D3_AURPU|nr:MFS general substrate transporter [Aureobasidium pullulans]THX06497.1 MFS general substrate transporter [Aureobasidium pullulans]THX93302.1 MFS general substrate transporter [Aureobasidium pullulans]THY03018.1 MFS general substrate transporter [Aureobasidium pullulans]THZ05746.1 MFS general substrate transporter [Aureobasidium pullulans]
MTAGPSKDTIEVLEIEQHEPASSKLPAVLETEVTPLLARDLGSLDGASLDNGPRRMSPRAILIIMGVLILIVQCGDQFSQAPLTRIQESIYCYQYWEKEDPTKILVPRSAIGPGALGGVEERLCKISEVQGKVAMLKGTQQFLDCVPSLILSIPVGILADRWGRRPIIVLGICSFPIQMVWQLVVCWFWQTFDLRVAWFSSLGNLAGGGSPVLSALFFVIISDVTTQETRSAVYLRIFAANLCANLICPPIAAWIMTFNPLIAIFLGIVCFAIGCPMCLLIPETLGYQDSNSKASEFQQSDEERPPLASKKDARNFLQRCYEPLIESTQYFLQDKRVICLIFTFVPVMLTTTAVPLLLQYTSTRYSMSFSQATLLLTVKAGVTIVMFLGMQSWIYKLLAKSGLSGRKRDLFLARGSACFMLLGIVAVGLSPNAILFTISLMIATLGGGFPVYLRSFLTDLVKPNKVAELYTVIGVVDTLALMVGGPLFAWLFERGLQLGGAFVGLPFLALGLIYAAVLVFLLKIGHSSKESTLEDSSISDE